MAVYNNSVTDAIGIYHEGTDFVRVYHMGDIVWEKGIGFELKTTKQTNFSITIKCSTYNTNTIHWGDGTTTLINSSSAKTKTFSASGSHTITIKGDLSKITEITCAAQELTEINLPKELINVIKFQLAINNLTSFSIPQELNAYNYLDISRNQLSGSVTINGGASVIDILYVYKNLALTSIVIEEGIEQINAFQCSYTAVSSIDFPSSLTVLDSVQARETHLTSFPFPENVTSYTYLLIGGDSYLISCTIPTWINQIYYLNAQESANLASINITSLTSVSYVYFNRCGLSQSEIDDVLSQCITISASETACYLDISNNGSGGAVNSKPSLSGLANVDTLRGIGWEVIHA